MFPNSKSYKRFWLILDDVDWSCAIWTDYGRFWHIQLIGNFGPILDNSTKFNRIVNSLCDYSISAHIMTASSEFCCMWMVSADFDWFGPVLTTLSDIDKFWRLRPIYPRNCLRSHCISSYEQLRIVINQSFANICRSMFHLITLSLWL